jgi:predicted nucleic acid-binding protein
MYILDTNVISELRKAKSGNANPDVIAWAGSIPVNQLFISVITVLELETGILQVERRDPVQGTILRVWMDEQVLPVFAERILAVDTGIALRCAKLHVPNRCAERDAVIAATALVHGMKVVTRNVADFEATGVIIVNPWQD